MSELSGPDTTLWVDRLIKALNAHDAEAVGEFMTDDVQYSHWWADSWLTVSGRRAVVALLDSYNKELSSDFQLSETFAVVTDGGFAIEYHESGTNDRGDRPSGRRFALRNVMVGELRAGKISRLTDYSDVTAYRAQIST